VKVNTMASVRVMLWGDSFLPSDNGETLGFQGNAVTGAGGVLDILTKAIASGGYGIPKSRIILVPWGYGPEYRNYVHPSPAYPAFDKLKQIQYMHNMGFDFLLGTGEAGPGYSVASKLIMDNHVQTFYEWVYAANRVNSGHFLGYMNMQFTTFNTGGSGDAAGNNAGYITPLVNYAIKHKSRFNIPFSASFFRNCDYKVSRNALVWDNSFLTAPDVYIENGNDYDGDGIADLAVKANASGGGTWKIDFSRDGFGAWNVSYPGYGDGSAEPVPADNDGDGLTDLAVKTTGGQWLIDYAVRGDGTAIPVPADYNGDGIADLSVKTGDGRWLIDYSVRGAPHGGFGMWDKSLSGYGDATAAPVAK